MSAVLRLNGKVDIQVIITLCFVSDNRPMYHIRTDLCNTTVIPCWIFYVLFGLNIVIFINLRMGWDIGWFGSYPLMVIYY